MLMTNRNDSRLRMDAAERTRVIRHRIVHSIMAGAIAALVAFAVIKGLRPSMFEDRVDRVVEQCTKTGLAVFALALLLSLSRDGRIEQ